MDAGLIGRILLAVLIGAAWGLLAVSVLMGAALAAGGDPLDDPLADGDEEGRGPEHGTGGQREERRHRH